jgi:hypothetical protein
VGSCGEQVLGQRWRELDEQTKGEYQARAVADRARYEEEMRLVALQPAME